MRDTKFRIGDWFLKLRGSTWYICRYDKSRRQTVSISTGLGDFEAAKKATLAHVTKVNAPKVDTDSSLLIILNTYYDQYASNLPSASTQRQAQRNALEVWGDINISALDRPKQLEFVEAMRDDGLADSTISTRLVAIWSAIHWFQRDNPTLIVPSIITAGDWKPLIENRKETYSVEQLAKLFNTIDERDYRGEREFRRRFMILNIATLSRVTALLELTYEQIDLAAGVIHLNPKGRRQTKKRRATVPITPTLAAEIRRWIEQDARDGYTGGRILHYRGARIGTRCFFQSVVEAAGLSGGPNRIRHTVRTWLAEMGVPDPDGDMMMGHADEGSSTGAIYKHRRPEFLRTVTQALELLFDAIQEHVPTPLGDRSAMLDQPLPENLDFIRRLNLETA